MLNESIFEYDLGISFSRMVSQQKSSKACVFALSLKSFGYIVLRF